MGGVDINSVVGAWELEQPIYAQLGKDAHKFIQDRITEYEIFPEISHRTKDLLSIIKKLKKKNKEKLYKYEDLTDRLGFRIICSYQEDLLKVDSFLRENFVVVKAEYKKDVLDFDKLDYTSNHYDLKVKTELPTFKKHPEYADLVFEMQVRTLNQHAWSNTAHSLSYKQEADISPILKRRVYRLLSLYEIADDEFSSVNHALGEDTDNIAYKLLRKLESKVYKYAKVDFDRASSLVNIKKILSFLDQEEQGKLVKGIDKFVSDNDQQLREIFEENRIRFHEMDMVTQPEIFIVWYALENFRYALTDNWADEFDTNELSQAAILWGISLD